VSVIPTEIERLGNHGVRIAWEDGHESEYRNADLRFGCSCALCVNEVTGVRHLRREQIPPDIRPTAVELVGHYAIHITWSDGHATGIYSYELLRELCPCAVCSQARSQGGG